MWSLEKVEPSILILYEFLLSLTPYITHASRLVANGAKLIYTNPDANCLVNGGIKPGCGMCLFLVSMSRSIQCLY